MSLVHVVQQQGQWLVFDGETVSRSDIRPKLGSAAMVVSDFDGAVSSVISLEGSPAHAVALIEKRLRSDGLIDGEAKILIHRTRGIGAGYQTLFTAVPLDTWQQTYAWAEAQPDHCLLVPTTSLVWCALKPGQGLVLQAGRQVSVMAIHGQEMLYRSALAYSDDPQDLAMTVGALAEQFADDLAQGDDGMQPLAMRWCPVLVPRPTDDGPWPDDMLGGIFAARSGLAITSVPLREVRDGEGREYRSGVAWMGSVAGPAIAVNPPLTRAAYVAERVLPFASAASLVFALTLAALGARWALSASEATARAQRLGNEIAQIETRMEGLRAQERVPDGFGPTLAFVERAAMLQRGADPAASLAQVRDAAAGQVRILRVRLEEPAPGAPSTPAPSPAGTGYTLRVDGVVDADRGTPGMQIATFVDRLRREGFDPQPIDPMGGNNNARSAGGVFSYLLASAAMPTETRP